MSEMNVNVVFQQFAEQVAGEFPELREVLDQAKTGDITEEDALRGLSEIVMANPDLGRRFQQVAMQALSPLRDEDRADPLDHGGLVMHKERGLPALNPLVEAALIERAQFDGDMPELRTGPLPEGVAPAVAVDTKVRNPVALGAMLKQASDQVAGEIATTEPERRRLIEQVAGGDTLALVAKAGSALAVQETRDLLFDGKLAAVDVPSYQRGKLPAPVKVDRPSGSSLLAMTPQERKQSAWQFLSTTQGRRTAIGSITELVEVKLKGEGFDVRVRPHDPTAAEPVLAAHDWTVGIDGPGAMQSAFNLIDIASAAIAKGLTSKMGDRRGRVTLEIIAVNTVDIRTVGWAGRLLSGDAALPPGE